jgi:hypothetical protein
VDSKSLHLSRRLLSSAAWAAASLARSSLCEEWDLRLSWSLVRDLEEEWGVSWKELRIEERSAKRVRGICSCRKISATRTWIGVMSGRESDFV